MVTLDKKSENGLFFLEKKKGDYCEQKLARGDRPHIFTGVKPLKTFYILLHCRRPLSGILQFKI